MQELAISCQHFKGVAQPASMCQVSHCKCPTAFSNSMRQLIMSSQVPSDVQNISVCLAAHRHVVLPWPQSPPEPPKQGRGVGYHDHLPPFEQALQPPTDGSPVNVQGI